MEKCVCGYGVYDGCICETPQIVHSFEDEDIEEEMEY